MTAYQQLEPSTTASVEDVWREFSGELRRFILRRVSSPEDADDILQLVALRLVQHSAEPRDRRTLLAWLYTVTRNTIAASAMAVTLGCGEECEYVPGVKYVDWPVADPRGQDEEAVRAIIGDIDGRVRRLLVELVPDITLPPSVLGCGEGS